jgi:DNA repair protein RecO (recombination protein O)
VTRGEQTGAVVLSTRPLRESDLLTVLFTAAHGKIRAVARGARKSKRRFAGGVPGGAVGEAELVPGRGGLWTLAGFVPRLDHGALGRDLRKLASVAYLCELVDVLVDEPETDTDLFAALVESIGALLDGPASPSILRWFELRLLAVLGHLPTLEVCCVCGEAVASARAPFDAVRGGVLCPAHHAGATPLASEVVELARALVKDGVAASARVDAAAEPVRRALRDLTAGMVRGHLRRPLKSLEFFSSLPRDA